MPTVLDILGINLPKTVNEYVQQPLSGESFYDSFKNADADSTHTVQYWENKGNRAVYQDGWKAVTEHTTLIGSIPDGNKGKFGKDTWELYNVAKDLSLIHI